MLLSLGQGFFDLPAERGGRPPFPFEQAQPVPQPDEFSLFPGVHDPLRTARIERTKNEKQASRYGHARLPRFIVARMRATTAILDLVRSALYCALDRLTDIFYPTSQGTR
jgi:hypothetical protein